MIRTPLLITEYVRGIEPKADFYRRRWHGLRPRRSRIRPLHHRRLRIAHLGEASGLDVGVHACGPAHRNLMSAMRNSNFYELALVRPDCPEIVAPVYTCG